MYIKQLPVTSPKLEKAETIEDILCLATLIASAEISPNSTLEDSSRWYKEETNSDCNNCLLKLVCVACISNE